MSEQAPSVEDDFEDEDEDLDVGPGKRTFGEQVVDFVRAWGPALLAVVLIRTFVFEPFRIPSGSMVPTLLIGDHVLVTKFSYGIWLPFVGTELVDLGDPDRGDIIVFKYPRNPSLNYIKRVVAIPGDTIKVVNNKIVLNGDQQPFEFQGDYTFVDDKCTKHITKRWTENLGGLEHTALTRKGLGGCSPTTKRSRSPQATCSSWAITATTAKTHGAGASSASTRSRARHTSSG